LFSKQSEEPYRLSRSKIELFMKCPRCFYLDRRLGVGQPPGPPFSLNSAVDTLLKKEFDIHRAAGTQHPFMKAYGLDAIPMAHEKIDQWRDSLGGGITYLHKPTNFFITGGIDDVWVNPEGELIIVDYKATAKNSEINIDAEWQISYKRQIELYQWLFRRNGFRVSPIGYFVYVNGRTDKESFDGKLEFEVKLIPYEGNDTWIEAVIGNIHNCLISDVLPERDPECDFCAYRKSAYECELK
jgi:CRISPR/Cas system-associated exonuclease Cas4 (RecB family)